MSTTYKYVHTSVQSVTIPRPHSSSIQQIYVQSQQTQIPRTTNTALMHALARRLVDRRSSLKYHPYGKKFVSFFTCHRQTYVLFSMVDTYLTGLISLVAPPPPVPAVRPPLGVLVAEGGRRGHDGAQLAPPRGERYPRPAHQHRFSAPLFRGVRDSKKETAGRAAGGATNGGAVGGGWWRGAHGGGGVGGSRHGVWGVEGGGWRFATRLDTKTKRRV